MQLIEQVSKDQLALLEFVLKFCPREDTAIMARRYALCGFLLMLLMEEVFTASLGRMQRRCTILM